MRKSRGFTLIELVIVVAIIAILAAIALPSFMNQIRKSRRADALQAMQQIALFEERFRADCSTYANAFNFACPVVLTPVFPANPYTSTYYTITIPTGTTTGYQISAAAVGTQANDKANGTVCTPLTYSFTAGVVAKTPADCWAN